MSIEDDLHRERLVRENLAARLGNLIAENIELLIRIHDLEHPAPVDSDNGHRPELVTT